MVRRLAALGAALSLSLLLVSPALATVPLNQGGNIDWNDAQFQGTVDECTGLGLQPGQVLWHFVLAGAANPDETLTASFADSSGNVIAMPPTKVEAHYTLQWSVITTETTLLTASATGTAGILNLSHICSGGPPPDVAEAPASALLLLAGGIGLVGFVLLRQRRSRRTA